MLTKALPVVARCSKLVTIRPPARIPECDIREPEHRVALKELRTTAARPVAPASNQGQRGTISVSISDVVFMSAFCCSIAPSALT